MRLRAPWIVIVLGATACAGAPKSPPKNPEVPIAERPVTHPPTGLPPLTQSWKKTAELISDPALQKKVDVFAALTMQVLLSASGGVKMARVDSPAIGEGGDSSKTYAAYQDLRTSLTHADAVALLQHENPAVRAYFAQLEILSITKNPDAPYILYSLFADSTPIQTLDGCLGSQTTVADYVVADVLDYGKPVIDHDSNKFLLMMVGDKRLRVSTRGSALAYLADLDPTTAHPIALAAARDADPAWRSEGSRALGVVGDPKDLDLITKAASKTPQDREALIDALGGIDSPESRAKLLALMSDDRDGISAVQAYARLASVTDDDLGALLKGNETVAGAAARELGDRATLHALQLVEPLLMDERAPIDEVRLDSFLEKVGARGFPVMRRLLSAKYRSVRDATVLALGHLGDRESIPVLHKELARDSSKQGAQATGKYLLADALGDLKATEAVDDLIKALHDENRNTIIAAATALGKIGAFRALPAVQAAAAKSDAYDKPKFDEAIAALKAAKTIPRAKP